MEERVRGLENAIPLLFLLLPPLLLLLFFRSFEYPRIPSITSSTIFPLRFDLEIVPLSIRGVCLTRKRVYTYLIAYPDSRRDCA